MLISPNVAPINTLSLIILKYYYLAYLLMVVKYRYLTLPVAIPFPMISLQHYLMIQLQSGLSMPILKESVYPTGLEKHHPAHFKGYSIPEDPASKYLDPASWKCTMIWSAYMGLPLSLEGVGAVLKLQDQKMKEGKRSHQILLLPLQAD